MNTNKNETIYISIIGDNNTGKSTFLNGLFCYDLQKKTNNLTFLKTNDKNNNEITDFFDKHGYVEKNNIIFDNIVGNFSIFNTNTFDNKIPDIYIITLDINKILQDNCDMSIINNIKNIIDTNNYGNCLIIINKCDDFSIEENNLIIDDIQMKQKYENFCANINKICDYPIIPFKSYDFYLYRMLYFCEEYNYDYNEIMNQKELQKDLLNIVKIQVGESIFKKSKQDLTCIEKMRKLLEKKLDIDEIYDTAMEECGYEFLKETINDILENNMNVITKNHINNNIQNIKLVNNNDINFVFAELKNTIIISNYYNKKEDDMKNIIIEYVNNEFTNLLSNLTPNQINNTMLKNTKEIKDYIGDNWDINVLDDLLENLTKIRNENLIDIFIVGFDIDLLAEIKDKLTTKILFDSLRNSINNINFESYLVALSDIAKILNYDINYISVSCMFILNYMNETYGKQIVHNMCCMMMMANNANNVNKELDYIFSNILYNMNINNILFINNDNYLMCNYDEYLNETNKFENFYKKICDILDEGKYRDITDSPDLKKFVYSLSNKYKKLSNLSLFVKKIIHDTSCILDAIKYVNKLHENNLLESSILELDTKKITKELKINMKNCNSDYSDGSDNSNCSELESSQEKKIIKKNNKKK
jgi:hypothetical protein